MKILSNKFWICELNLEPELLTGVVDIIEDADAVVIFTDNFNINDTISKKAIELSKKYSKPHMIIPISNDNLNYSPVNVNALFITGQDNFQTHHAIHKIHQILNSLLGEYI